MGILSEAPGSCTVFLLRGYLISWLFSFKIAGRGYFVLAALVAIVAIFAAWLFFLAALAASGYFTGYLVAIVAI